MQLVNPYFLNNLMSPITGLGDDDEEVRRYMKMGIITEQKYREIIDDKIVNYYKNLDKDKQEKTKIALSYYLSKPEADFERVFESCVPPFDPPANARNFFVWVWEELFNQESYSISDLKGYKVVPNIYEPQQPTKK